MSQGPKKGFWKEAFRLHLIALEKFLGLSDSSPALSGRLSGACSVYLAGMIARELDTEYKRQSRRFLMEDPDEMKRAVRRHAPYIGQNAPLVTLSRINAEHHTLQLAISGRRDASPVARLSAAYYFGIASFYSSQAGNRNLADIYSFFKGNLQEMTAIISRYFIYLIEHPLNEEIPPEVFRRFARNKESMRPPVPRPAESESSREWARICKSLQSDPLN